MDWLSFISLILLFCSIFGNSFSSRPPCGDCLILTPFIKNSSVNQARSLSEVNPTRFLNIKSYTGFITVNEEYDSNLFFWFVPVNHNLSSTPWILWLNGGPGYSSMKGLFDLVGPFKLENGDVTKRSDAWTDDYSLLFLDNPAGTGFSFTCDDRGYTINEDEVGSQMYEFFGQFTKLFPELQQAPLFLFGESYAGKYVTALGTSIHRNLNNNPINLKGIGIGNGLVDPRSIMHYSELCRIMGILDDNGVEFLKILETNAVKYIDERKFLEAYLMWNQTVEYIKKHSGISIFNLNEDPSESLPEYDEFLQREDIRKIIHVGNASYDINNQHVCHKMSADFMNTTKPWLEELLDHYGVMWYSGQLDILLPYGLSKYTYAELKWSKRNEYDDAPRRRLRHANDKRIAAYKKHGGNFAEVLIRGAGHMVPSDQPEIMKYILDRFIADYI